MENKGIWDSERDMAARLEIRREVLKAFGQAESEKKPRLREMFEGVYAEMSEDGKADRKELGRILDTYPEEYDIEEFEGGRDGL